MNILHISASHTEKNKHSFSYHFKKTGKKMGINIISISPYDGKVVSMIEDDFNESFIDYYVGKKIFPLSALVKKYKFFDPDLIFIENPKWAFDNDTDTCVLYYHRDLISRVFVKNPDYLALRFWTNGLAKDMRPSGGQPELIEIWHPEIWYNDDVKRIWLTNAISEEEFDELNKSNAIKRTKRGFAYLGSYKSVTEMMTYNSVHYKIYKHHYDIIKVVKQMGLASLFKEVNTSLNTYKKHLFEYDATLIIPAWDSWETRRLYEASYCKCVPILYVQNEFAREIFARQGYIHNKTCITFSNISELIHLELKDYDLASIRSAGHSLVKKRHTYKSRILNILELVQIDDILKKKGKTEEIKNRIYI